MIELHQGDCLEVMRQLIDKGIKVDAVMTDLPYGITKNYWDSIIPLNEMWNKLNKITNDNTPIILFGNQPFTSILVTSNLKMFRYSLVWVKNKFSDFLNAKRKQMKTYLFFIKINQHIILNILMENPIKDGIRSQLLINKQIMVNISRIFHKVTGKDYQQLF